MTTKALATATVKGGGRTVFLDVNRARNERLYLTVTSLGKGQDGGNERRSVVIFEDQLADFQSSLGQVLQAAGGATNGVMKEDTKKKQA